jgi:hypothetical protein
MLVSTNSAGRTASFAIIPGTGYAILNYADFRNWGLRGLSSELSIIVDIPVS